MTAPDFTSDDCSVWLMQLTLSQAYAIFTHYVDVKEFAKLNIKMRKDNIFFDQKLTSNTLILSVLLLIAYFLQTWHQK